MSVSNLSFSAYVPPFYYTSGYNSNFSNANTSLSGNLLLTSSTNSNGFTSTNVSSNVNSGGASYAETGATFNGNQLTVNYQTDSTDLSILGNANISGTGISFNPTGATNNGGALTTSYDINGNSAIGETVQGAGVSTGFGSQNIQLESVATVGNSLTVTFDVGGAPVSTTTLAPTAAPQSSAPTPPVTPGASTGATFTSHGITTIGELLASSNGLSLTGNFNSALQSQTGASGQSNGTPDEALVLAATLNPSINLAPNNALQVTDFANTSLDAFPTTSPQQATAIYDANTNTNTNTDTGTFLSLNGTNNNDANNNNDLFGNGANNAIADQNATPSFGDNNTQNFGAFAQSTSIYSAVADANASNILGSNFNAVA